MGFDNRCCSDCCGHSHKNNYEGSFEKIKIILGILLFVAGATFSFMPLFEFGIFFVSYLLLGGDILLLTLKNILNLKKNGIYGIFDENFLMSIATLGAFAIGEYPEGVAVMLFYKIGEKLQEKAVENSKKSISSLLDLKVESANLQKGKKVVKVPVQNVRVGDTIVIKAGEKVPLDGVVKDGKSFLDTSAISGESMPKEVKEGSEILSGCINQGGTLHVRVICEFKDSTISKIAKFVEEAGQKKSKTEHFIRKFAKIYTPIVVFIAITLAFLPPIFIENAEFSEWFYKALVFLVISCPCALVVSIPLSFFAGLGGASKRGILIKGGNYLEALSHVNTVVFDKTGTLTKGEFGVSKIKPSSGFSEEELLFYAAHIESFSPHPIALSILKEYKGEIKNEVKNHEELFGFGVKAEVSGRLVLAGNEKLMELNSIVCEKPNAIGSVVHVAIDGIYAGYIVVCDTIKDESKKTVQDLKDNGVKDMAILTGDSEQAAKEIARELGINNVFAQLLPLEKVEKLELLSKNIAKGKKLVFVGDGINDAPSLAKADIGMAISTLDITTQSADVVLTDGNLQKVSTAIKIAKKTSAIAKQNIVFALSVKVLLMTLGVVGISGMWEAVFADVGVTILAVLNALRVIGNNIKSQIKI
ncbi:MAG: cadmium-translocating P-type ATPase [Campylobacteraceae bacterium]|jgi:Cd2+/Zn2+-exporting ATPase|nr:cadmium-translocating P-type ATPase [Campylobacteraceae bacterium]